MSRMTRREIKNLTDWFSELHLMDKLLLYKKMTAIQTVNKVIEKAAFFIFFLPR